MKIYSAFRVSFRAARNNLHAHRDPIKMDYLCVFCLSEGEEREREREMEKLIEREEFNYFLGHPSVFDIVHLIFRLINGGNLVSSLFKVGCGVIDFEIIVVFLIVSPRRIG